MYISVIRGIIYILFAFIALKTLRLLSISEVENAVWAAMSAGGADAVVRRDSCRLDFFGTFLIKQKSTEENRYILQLLSVSLRASSVFLCVIS